MLKFKQTLLKWSILAFLTFAAINPTFSQSKINVDSLTDVLNKYPKDDTGKAKLLITLSDALTRVNAKEGIAYSERALAIAENFQNSELKADALFVKARHLKDQFKRTESLDLAKQALDIYEPLRRLKKMADIHILLANIYADKADVANGKKQCELAIALSEQIGDWGIKIAALNGLGLVYMGASGHKSAIPYLEQSADLAKKQHDTKGEAIASGNLGLCHIFLGNYTKAIDYLQSAVRLNESIGNEYNLAYNYRNLGSIYVKLSEQDKALAYYNKGLSMAIKTEHETLEAELYGFTGTCYKILKRYEEAIVSIKKGIEINKKKGKSPDWWALGSVYEASGRLLDAHRYFQESVTESKQGNKPGTTASAMISIGHLYAIVLDSLLTRMGVSPSDRYPKALALITQAVEMSKKLNAPQKTVAALEVLSDIYDKNKDYAKAYNTYKEYITLKDSIKGDEVKQQITRKEIQYEFDKKETVFKYEQQLTAEQLEQQKLLTVQGEQALTLNQQNLTLKEQALALSNKETDLAHLAYLKEQAEKQEKTDQLSLSEEREKGKERDLSLKNVELSAQQKQNLYLGLFSFFLLGGLGVLSYFYSTLKKQKNIIAQQNELNEQTIAILSHDIKEPLLGVKLLLKKLNKDDPFVAQASQSLEGQINSVNGILNNLLKMKKLSLIKKDKNATTTAKTVVNNVIQELSVAIQSKSLTIQNELEADVMLPIAAEKLQIIVHNLLSNAVKYSFPNQQIRIFKEGKGISIQDFGVGLSPEQRTKLMREVTASQRGTRQERGNGLGLFLVGAMLQGEAIKVIFDSPEVGGTIAKVLG
jgi:signal transduction histidine kinase